MSNEYRKMAVKYKQYASRVTKNTLGAMNEIADDIVLDAKAYLSLNGSIDTGALYDSIRQETKIDDGGQCITHIYTDARSPEGTEYAEFVEYGTGIHNDHGDGRQTPWSYQDRHGEWHTTQGQVAKPFMRPALATNLPRLQKTIQKSLQMEDKERNWHG